MGNLIKDFWTLPGQQGNLYGIIEVVKGEDLGQQRNIKKYENHIEKALQYTMENKVLSHMSIQTYSRWLQGRSGREDWESKYYPFILEFEGKNDGDYYDVACEAAVYINYLATNLNVNKDDILIMINNSRSIYVYVNPKAYNLKPDNQLHIIYSEMYRKIKAELGLVYVDESIVTSTYKLMKTPNCFYKGGYFVSVTIEELMKLMTGSVSKQELTRQRRSLNRDIPGQIALGFAKLYTAAVKRVKSPKSESQKDDGLTGTCGKCIKYLMQHMIEKGHRNYGLVSVGIYLKELGYTKEEVKKNLMDLAASWNHDESEKDINAKVNSIFRKNYKFSCSYAQTVYADLGIENMCSSCPRNIKNRKLAKVDAVLIDAEVINQLWASKGSTRHYMLYLELLNKDLMNTEFVPEEHEINERTLRELCNLSASLSREKKDSKTIITYKASKKRYMLPRGFISNTASTLGEYLKHYLKLFVKGYKAVEKYIITRMSIEKMMEELDYSDVSSLYKMIKRLKDLGLIKESNFCDYCLYYESYKVIDINPILEVPEERTTDKEHLDAILEAVVGEQIIIKDVEASMQLYFDDKYSEKYLSKKVSRGSPGSGAS